MNNILIGELLGTAVLVMLGRGGMANAIYSKAKGQGGGPVAIGLGWAAGVYMGILVANAWNTGGHINPAITLAVLFKGGITLQQTIVYIVAQILGATLGQAIVNTIYKYHIQENEPALVFATHFTSPTHKNAKFTNFFAEAFGTFLLLTMFFLAGRYFAKDLGPMFQFVAPFSTAIVVFGIASTLGGQTGPAINPAIDLGPRIWYALTLRKKAKQDWSYSWVPILGPIIGGIIAALIF